MKFLLLSSVSSELLRGLAHEKINLEPGYAADLFINVEDQWINEASQLDGLKRVQASCGQIATAIIQGSEGDESKVEEYLSTVCNEKSFGRSAQWHKGLCQAFTNRMTTVLEKNDAEYNRNYLDVKKICTAFYDDISSIGEVEEKRRIAQEKADKEEEIRKKIEDERKKAEERHKAEIAAAAKAKAPAPKEAHVKKQVIKAHQKDVEISKAPHQPKPKGPKGGKVIDKVVAVAKPPHKPKPKDDKVIDKVVAVAKAPHKPKPKGPKDDKVIDIAFLVAKAPHKPKPKGPKDDKVIDKVVAVAKAPHEPKPKGKKGEKKGTGKKKF